MSMTAHVCPSCAGVTDVPDLNDDVLVNPKIKIDELVHVGGHGTALYRVLEIKGVQLLLEKL